MSENERYDSGVMPRVRVRGTFTCGLCGSHLLEIYGAVVADRIVVRIFCTICNNMIKHCFSIGSS